MLRILTLNNIAEIGLRRLPPQFFEVGTDFPDPDAVILRSQNMHDMEIPVSVAAIARAGAGTNNIPIDAMSARGVPVFNTPGANANAVKELAIAGLLIAARNLCDAREYVKGLTETGDALGKAVEAGKKQFVGFELPGKTLGVVGLGAIGVEVANAALALGMKVIGFDPKITVRNAGSCRQALNTRKRSKSCSSVQMRSHCMCRWWTRPRDWSMRSGCHCCRKGLCS
jgi:D-3-phosphoglycerate dehydrogenase